MLSYYDLLNVDARASTAEIKKAFRERAKELHPDRNPESGTELRELFAERAEADEVRSMAGLPQLFPHAAAVKAALSRAGLGLINSAHFNGFKAH